MREHFYWWLQNYDDGSLEMYDYYEACFKVYCFLFKYIDNTTIREAQG